MTQPGISLGVSPRETVDRFVSVVRRADEAGVDACWVVDSQLAMKDAYVAIAVAARETDRIQLGPGVTNVVTRHETVVANAMATLAELAPGRILAGIGVGDSAVFPIGGRPSTIAESEGALRRLRALMRGEAVPTPGGDVTLSFRPPAPPPIFFAASQPRTLRLAGAVADGVIVMGPSDPETVAMQLALVDEGAASAGRHPEDVFRDLWVTIAVGDGAVDDVKSWASAQARWLTTWKTVPASLERFRPEMVAAAQQYDFGTHLSRRADHAATISSELACALAVAGPAEVCAARIEALRAAGPDRITMTLLSGGRERRLDDITDVWTRASAVDA